jgi:hypothetical protein
MHKLAALILPTAILAGCGSQTLIPDETVAVAPTYQPTVAAVVAVVLVGVATYYIVDPQAPNWEVKIDQIDETRVAINLRKKRFAAGGDGEAREIFRRKAQQITEENGFAGYQILQFSEGVDSETTYARRVSRGVIELARPS